MLDERLSAELETNEEKQHECEREIQRLQTQEEMIYDIHIHNLWTHSKG